MHGNISALFHYYDMNIIRLKKISKKGIDGSQINWIFMMIAGITILLFFFFVVQRQRVLSKEALSEKILTSLQQLFTGAAVSTGATNYFETPLVRFDFTCDKDTCTAFGCGDSAFLMPEYSKMRKTLATQPLFSAGTMKGNGMTVMTKPWNVPFRAVNFVYITSPSVYYVIIYDKGSSVAKENAEELYNNLLPAEVVYQKGKDRRIVFKKLYASDDEDEIKKIANIQHENLKAIFVGPSNLLNSQLISRNLAESGASKIRGIHVESNTEYSAYGSVGFYKFNKEKKEWTKEGNSYFATETGFLGAVYADDMDNYECNMMKAMAVFSQIGNLYEIRRQSLQEAAENNARDACKVTYKQAGEMLGDLLNLKKDGEMISITKENFEEIYKSGVAKSTRSLSSLDDYNNKLQKQSCPVIY